MDNNPRSYRVPILRLSDVDDEARADAPQGTPRPTSTPQTQQTPTPMQNSAFPPAGMPFQNIPGSAPASGGPTPAVVYVPVFMNPPVTPPSTAPATTQPTSDAGIGGSAPNAEPSSGRQTPATPLTPSTVVAQPDTLHDTPRAGIVDSAPASSPVVEPPRSATRTPNAATVQPSTVDHTSGTAPQASSTDLTTRSAGPTPDAASRPEHAPATPTQPGNILKQSANAPVAPHSERGAVPGVGPAPILAVQTQVQQDGGPDVPRKNVPAEGGAPPQPAQVVTKRDGAAPVTPEPTNGTLLSRANMVFDTTKETLSATTAAAATESEVTPDVWETSGLAPKRGAAAKDTGATAEERREPTKESNEAKTAPLPPQESAQPTTAPVESALPRPEEPDAILKRRQVLLAQDTENPPDIWEAGEVQQRMVTPPPAPPRHAIDDTSSAEGEFSVPIRWRPEPVAHIPVPNDAGPKLADLEVSEPGKTSKRHPLIVEEGAADMLEVIATPARAEHANTPPVQAGKRVTPRLDDREDTNDAWETAANKPAYETDQRTTPSQSAAPLYPEDDGTTAELETLLSGLVPAEPPLRPEVRAPTPVPMPRGTEPSGSTLPERSADTVYAVRSPETTPPLPQRTTPDGPERPPDIAGTSIQTKGVVPKPPLTPPSAPTKAVAGGAPAGTTRPAALTAPVATQPTHSTEGGVIGTRRTKQPPRQQPVPAPMPPKPAGPGGGAAPRTTSASLDGVARPVQMPAEQRNAAGAATQTTPPRKPASTTPTKVDGSTKSMGGIVNAPKVGRTQGGAGGAAPFLIAPTQEGAVKTKHAQAIAEVAQALHSLRGTVQDAEPWSGSPAAHGAAAMDPVDKEQDVLQMLTTSGSSIPAVRTFKHDVEESAMRTKTALDVVTSATPALGMGQVTIRSRERPFLKLGTYAVFGLIGVMLVGIGVLGVMYAIPMLTWEPPAETDVITSDEQTTLDVSNITRTALMSELVDMRETQQLKQGGFLSLDLTEQSILEGSPNPVTKPLNGRKFLTKLEMRTPQTVTRSLTERMSAGLHEQSGNQPFIALETSYWEAALSGMLEWEKAMSDDLAPWFPKGSLVIPMKQAEATPVVLTPQIATTTSSSTGELGTTTATVAPPLQQLAVPVVGVFEDVVIANERARLLRDGDGTVRIVWGIVKQKTIIITTNEETFEAVAARLER